MDPYGIGSRPIDGRRQLLHQFHWLSSGRSLHPLEGWRLPLDCDWWGWTSETRGWRRSPWDGISCKPIAGGRHRHWLQVGWYIARVIRRHLNRCWNLWWPHVRTFVLEVAKHAPRTRRCQRLLSPPPCILENRWVVTSKDSSLKWQTSRPNRDNSVIIIISTSWSIITQEQGLRFLIAV